VRNSWLGWLQETASANRDLVGVMAGELLAILFLLVAPRIGPLTILEAAVAAAAALALPGYALACAILPRRLALLERLVISLGTGCVNAVALALILSILPMGLGRLQWTVAFLVVTLGACFAALRQRGDRIGGQPPTVEALNAGTVAHIALFALSVAIAVAAIGLRVTEGPPQGPGFTQLWALPDTSGSRVMIEVGVRNAEGQSTGYRLDIVVSGDLQRRFTFILATGQEWSQLLGIDSIGAGHGEALLYRDPEGSTPYRRVDLPEASAVALPTASTTTPP
jgi:uncharacterized membrane protein